MRHRRRFIALAAATALTVVTAIPTHAAKTTPEQFIGTWSGTWPKGNSTIELRVERMDADGNAHGTYCWVSNTNPWRNYIDLDVDAANATFEKKKLRFKIDKQRWAFSVRGKGEETTLRMEFWNKKGNKRTLRKLTRINIEDTDCISRLAR